MLDNQSSERFLRLPDGTQSRASETTEVFMAGSGQGPSSQTVEIQPGQPHTIATNSLAGCSSVALIGRDATGRSLLHMNHFPPLLDNGQKMDLESVSPRFASLDQTNTKVSVLVAVPGEWQKNSKGRYEMAPKDRTRVEALTNAALSGFGDRSAVDVSVLPYSETMQHGRHNGFIIKLPLPPTANSVRLARNDLWFN